MKGSIRIVLGLLLVMGGVGGIETDTSNVALPLEPLMVAIVGLAIFAWGTLAVSRSESA
jgi:hypothetical protein